MDQFPPVVRSLALDPLRLCIAEVHGEACVWCGGVCGLLGTLGLGDVFD